MSDKRKAPVNAPGTKKTKTTLVLPASAVEWLNDTTKLLNIIVEEKRERDIVVFRYDTTVGDAMNKLAEQHILSAPVTASGEPIHSQADDFFLGIFDSSTVLSILMDNPLIRDAEDGNSRWASVEEAIKQVASKKLVDVLQRGESHYFNKPVCEASVADVIYNGFFFGDPNTESPAHRLAVWENNHLQTLLTQVDVLHFLNRHLDHLGDFVHHTVKQLIGFKPVVTINGAMNAADAFHFMVENNVSSLAIVNDAGEMISNLQASDLLGLSVSDLAMLHKENVARFVQLRHEDIEKKTNKKHRNVHLTTCKPGTHLKTAMALLAENDCHQIYVQDTKNHPVGIITLTDILKLFAVFKN